MEMENEKGIWPPEAAKSWDGPKETSRHTTLGASASRVRLGSI